MTEPLLTGDEVAALLNVKPSTVTAWRKRRVGPPFVRLEQSVRYRRADVEAWLAADDDRDARSRREPAS